MSKSKDKLPKIPEKITEKEEDPDKSLQKILKTETKKKQ